MDAPGLDLAAYRSLAQGLPLSALAVVDHDLRFLLADGELIEKSGFSGAKLAGQRMTDLFPPEVLGVFVPLYRRALEGEASDEVLSFGKTTLRHFTRPVRDAAGAVVAAVALTQDISAETRSAESLKLSERRFRALVEYGSDAMLLIDESGRIIEQGPSVPHVWGWHPREAIGRSLLDVVHPDERVQAEVSLKAARGSPGAHVTLTLRIRHRDGSWRWAEATASNLLGEPAVNALVVNFHDITPWRVALEALRVVSQITATTLGEDFLHSVVLSLAEVLGVSNVVIAILNPDGALEVVAGHGLAKALGKLDTQGRVVGAILRGDEIEETPTATGAAVADPLLTALGATSVVGLPLRAPDGHVSGMLAVLDDKPLRDGGQWRSILRLFAARAASEIARLDREVALRRSEQLNRQLLEALPNGLLQVDRMGAITRANSLALSMLGLVGSSAGGGPYQGDFADRLVNEDLTPCPAMDLPIRRSLIQGVADGPRTLGIRSDESVTWGVFSAVPLHDANGGVDGAMMCFLDITERKRLEDQLRHSQKMDAIGKLAGGVAHDFNNLLTVILGRSELLLDRLPPEDKTREDIKLFHRTASRAAGLTRQLLAISRQQVSDQRVIDVNHAVTHMSDLLRGLLGEHIELRTVLEPRLGRILADPSHIEQVVLNLCVNARDAMQEGGVLTIQTANAEVKHAATAELKAGRYVLIVVKDTGHGIDPRIQSRIFEPFFTTKINGKGTGLGLSTVFGIARQHAGSVTVRSEVGKGSAFFVYLPRSDMPADPSGPHLALADSAVGSETILLVEDHDELRAMLEGLLSTRGYRLITARDGRDALLQAENNANPIDLLVTDMVMPGMGGRELATRLASRTPAVSKVLFITGYTEEPLVAERGCQFLQKPFSSDTLMRTVRELLDS